MPARESTAPPSSAPRYDLVFTGNLRPGTDARRARLRLTAFFRLSDPAAVEPFFGSGAVTLRRALPEAEAQQLCARLAAGGLECHLMMAQPESEPEPEPRPLESASPPNRFQIRSDMPSADNADAESLQLHFLATAVGTTLAGLLLAVALLTWLFQWSPAAPVTGPENLAAAADGTLYILAGDRLLVHDRAGSSTATYSAADLGFQAMHALLSIRGNRPILSARAMDDTADARRPWECSMDSDAGRPACETLTTESVTVASLAASRLTSTQFAINDAPELLRIASGKINQRSPLPANNAPLRVINHRGLLLINNSEGPGIGVYRPDAAAFGQQLDEILLLHPEAIARSQHRVLDFALTASGNWALLTDGTDADLYRFDEDWAPEAAIALPSLPASARMATWRDRLLVYAPDRLEVERVSPDGRLEAPLLSESLASLAAVTRADVSRTRLGFIVGLLVLAVATLCGGLLTWMSFHRRSTRDTPPAAPAFQLEPRLPQFRWLPPDVNRAAATQKWSLACLALAPAFCLAVAAGMAALAALCLPAFLFSLAARYYLALPAPQIGIDGDRVALVDHRGVYQTGTADSFHTCGPFVFRGGVIGCTHLPGIPGLEVPLRKKRARLSHNPLQAGMPGHPASVLEKLLQSRHPLLVPALAIPLGLIIVALWLTLPPAT